MPSSDTAFAGSIPAIYNRLLAPLLFVPYARDMAERASRTGASAVLETAAGTGLATVELARLLPGARIVATDLNPGMLEVAQARRELAECEFKVADAQTLPFADESFDLVVCQFGMMFLPDRASGYREALRVLRPGGTFLFNVWDGLEANPATATVVDALARLWPDDPPGFFGRVPFGYHDLGRIDDELRAAGFPRVEATTVAAQSHSDSAYDAAFGLCQGTPVRGEIEARGDLDEATRAAADALRARFGDGPIDAPMSAHVISARK